MLREYYRLAKPGIIYGNGITTIAAFLYASQWRLPLDSFLVLFIPTILGISLVIGSACVFNNMLDRDLDAKMPRTKHRALVVRSIPLRNALRFGTALGVVGFALLFSFVNLATTLAALLGFISYTGIYTIMKRHSHWAAVIGTIPGAVPIVVGYTAVTGRVDEVALALFVVLVTWQLPHFYSIALFRSDEYAEANIPVLPLKKGVKFTKVSIVLSIATYFIATVTFYALGYTSSGIYFAVVAVTSTIWLFMGLRGFAASDTQRWARKLFRFSLIVLLLFCFALAFAPLLP